MRKAYDTLWPVARIAGSFALTVYLTYLLWWGSLVELWHTLRFTTSASVVEAMVAGCVILLASYGLTKRYGWMHHNVYHWLVPLVKGWIRQPYLGRLQLIISAASSDGHEDDEDDDWGSTIDNHWLAQKVDYWVGEAMRLTFWLMACIGLNDMLHHNHAPWWSMALRLLVLTSVVALLGLALRNVAMVAGLIIWLDYTFIVHGELASAIQAAIVGLAVTLWALWARWQKRINNS